MSAAHLAQDIETGAGRPGREESAMDVQRIWGPVAAVAVAVTSLGAAPAPAAAQERVADIELSARAWATPSKAGTKRNPRGVKIEATAKIVSEEGYEPPIVTGVDILMGKGLVWRADDYVKCSKPVLDRRGPDGCPPKSIVGSVDATARADNIVTHPDVVLVNAGWKRTFAYTTLYRPALVEETIVVHRTRKSGRWSHQESLRVPKVLQVVAGVPIQVTAARLSIGGKPWARDYIVSTSCPKGGWKYRATAYYLFSTGATGQDTIDGSIPCTR